VKHAVTWHSKEKGNRTVWLRDTEIDSCKYQSEDCTMSSRSPSLNSSSWDSPHGSPETHSSSNMNKGNSVKNSPMNDVDSNQQQLHTYSSNCNSSFSAKKWGQQDQTLFELIKAQCNSNPWLKENIIKWGMSQGSKPGGNISFDNIQRLSQGRLYITVSSTQSQVEDDESSQVELDELKGAYEEYERGVFRQPKSQKKGEGIQHRLLKGSVGQWVIEKYDFKSQLWCPRAEVQKDGHWVDLKNNQTIQVRIVPLLRILQTLKEDGAPFQDLEKNLEFLFTACNQRKLNGKLRGRNLKHNIANLKSKLEKQYALSFAVLVANTAEDISL